MTTIIYVIIGSIIAAMTFFFIGVIIVAAWPLFLVVFLALITKGALNERRL